MRRPAWRRPIAIATLLMTGTLTVAVTAANTVPTTYAATHTQGIDANGLAPAECGGIALAGVVGAAGDIIGTSASDLILGSGLVQLLDGGDGDDCLVAGGAADVINGGPGADVCIGSALAVFIDCEAFFVY